MKTILFDLDGTLLPIQPHKFPVFFQDYVQAITGYCAHFVEPELFTQALLNATKLMFRNDGSCTNEDLFMSHFLPALNLKKEEIYPLLEGFYLTEFKKLKKHTEPTEIAGQLVQAALDRDFQVVLATNPVFPRVAIDERMAWANIKDYPWHYVTSYEQSRACKPSLLFYQDLVEELSLEPQECWMIGNDRDEDLVAGRLGFHTFLVADECIGEGADAPSPSAQGSRQELLQYMRNFL
jgi:FMN phosphatase YigB (HAD superfamily)